MILRHLYPLIGIGPQLHILIFEFFNVKLIDLLCELQLIHEKLKYSEIYNMKLISHFHFI